MKNYILILLLILVSVGCSRKQRSNEGFGYGNYMGYETLIINADCPFLTNGQFNQAILDTTKMYRFDRDTGIKLLKVIQRLDYKYRWYRFDLDMYHNREIEDNTISFYCMGKLNLQSNVNSFIIMQSHVPTIDIDDGFGNSLRLFNIKDNKICSIVSLVYLVKINTPLCPSICIKNKIFKKTKMEEDYFLRNNFGDRFKMKDKEVFSTFKIDENGFLEFTKD